MTYMPSTHTHAVFTALAFVLIGGVAAGCGLQPYISYPPAREDPGTSSWSSSASSSSSSGTTGTINTVTTDPSPESGTSAPGSSSGSSSSYGAESTTTTGDPVECSCNCPVGTAHNVELLCQQVPFDHSQCEEISTAEPCEVCTVLRDACITDEVDEYTCDSIKLFCELQTLEPCGCTGLP